MDAKRSKDLERALADISRAANAVMEFNFVNPEDGTIRIPYLGVEIPSTDTVLLNFVVQWTLLQDFVRVKIYEVDGNMWFRVMQDREWKKSIIYLYKG